MDSRPLLSLLISFLLLLVPSSTAVLCADPPRSSAGATDLSIFHTRSKCTPFTPPPSHSPSELDLVISSAKTDLARVAYLSSLLAQKSTKVPVASGLQFMQTNNYVLRAKFGTPGQLLFLALDTGSDASWVPCSGCVNCPASNASFQPPQSSTYKSVDCASTLCPQFKGLACASESETTPCGFNMSYGGDSFSACLSQDSLRLALDIVPDYAFGCVNSVTGGGSMPKQGLLGLGRGSNGLLAQSSSLYQVKLQSYSY